MAISSESKVAYIYQDGTWYPLASGSVNTAASYDWTGNHSFASAVSFSQVVTAKAGVNNFQNPAARDIAIESPVNGLVVFVRNDADGNQINQIQYYFGGSWINYNAVSIKETTTSYTIALEDVDKFLKVNSSSNLTVTVPPASSQNFPIGSRLEVYRAGTGEVTFVAGAGVDIRSKLNNTRISTQFSGAMLTKIGTNEWHLIGDLKASA